MLKQFPRFRGSLFGAALAALPAQGTLATLMPATVILAALMAAGVLLGAPTLVSPAHAVPITIKGAAVDTATVDLHLFDGELFLQQGHISQALEQFQVAYHLDPNRERTRVLLADTITRVILEGRAAEPGPMGRDAIKHWLWLSVRQQEQRRAIDSLVELSSFFGAHTGELLESKPAKRAWARAQEAESKDDYTEAIAQLRRVLELEPQALGVRGHLGQALLHNGDHAAAEAAFRGAVEDNPYDAPAVSGMARALEEQGKIREALNAYKDAIHSQFRDPSTAQGVLRLMEEQPPEMLQSGDAFAYGQALLITRDVEAAIPYLQSATNRNPDPEHYRALGTAQYFAQNYAEAVNALLTAYEANPDLETTYYLGAAFLEMGQQERGARFLREVLARDPDNPNALRLLGLNLARAPGLETEAIDTLQRAVASGASIPDLPCLLGMLNSRINEKEEARRQFSRCVKGNPDYAPAHLALGLMADEQGDHGQTIIHLERYLQLVEPDAGVLMRLGVAYLRVGETDRGYAALEDITQLNPSAAADTAQAAPNRQTLLEMASFFLASAHRYDDAIWVGEQLVDMDPENAVYNNNLAMVYADARRELDRAHELAIKATTLDPDNPGHMDTLAWTLVRLGRHQEAETMLLESIRVAEEMGAQNLSEIYYHLGYLYREMGRSAESRRWLQKAGDNPPTRHLRDAIDSLLTN